MERFKRAAGFCLEGDFGGGVILHPVLTDEQLGIRRNRKLIIYLCDCVQNVVPTNGQFIVVQIENEGPVFTFQRAGRDRVCGQRAGYNVRAVDKGFFLLVLKVRDGKNTVYLDFTR